MVDVQYATEENAKLMKFLWRVKYFIAFPLESLWNSVTFGDILTIYKMNIYTVPSFQASWLNRNIPNIGDSPKNS
jgi:hypothetical protein